MLLFWWMDAVSSKVAENLGIDLVAVRLVISVFLGYPIATIFSLFSPKWSIVQRQLFLFLTGAFLYYWNFGLDIIHMFIGIFVTLMMNSLFFRTKISVVFAFVFNMTYLISGSYIYNRGTYDINWTTPYCILCLRLIGLTWDLFDSTKPIEELSASQKKSALSKLPGILETVSFCFVPTAFITGPQFSMRHYQSFLDGSLRPYSILQNRSFMERFVYNTKVRRTVIRLFMGILAIGLVSKLLPIFPAEFMLTDEFQQTRGFIYRYTYMIAFAQITMLRYVAVWLIGEGACVLLGLGCTGLVNVHHLNSAGQRKIHDQPEESSHIGVADPSLFRTQSALARRGDAVPWTELVDPTTGQFRHDMSQAIVREADHTACASISLANLLLATNTDHLVAGFNINTNKWVLEYIYKRLRFLGNKRLSQVITLLFLAIWHGSYSGYFVNFGMEFITIAVETDFLTIVKRSKWADFLYKTKSGFVLTSVCGKLHVLFLLASPMVAFYLLHYHLWFPVFKSTYFFGFIYLLWPLFKPLVKMLFPSKSSITGQADRSQPNGPTSMSNNTVDAKKQL